MNIKPLAIIAIASFTILTAQASQQEHGCIFKEKTYQAGELITINERKVHEEYKQRNQTPPEGEYLLARCGFIIDPNSSEYPNSKRYVWTEFSWDQQ